MRHVYKPLLGGLFIWVSAFAFAGDTSDKVISEGQKRLKQNQGAQESINEIHEKTVDIVEEYQALLKVVDGLKVYNSILAKQLANQEAEMQVLDHSIANAAVIERQILPLLTRMLDGLEEFVLLDVPFLQKERLERVVNLRKLIIRSDLTNAEKTRRVFEAFQIENDFGNTIETYKGKLKLDSGTFDVDFLRMGRISYTYRTVGGDSYGYWDNHKKSWRPLSESKYQRNIDKGIKMARQEMAPELITIPVVNTKESI